MADFWRGFGEGFSKQASRSWERAADKRARREELEDQRKIRAKELEDAMKARREEATDARNWRLTEKDLDRAYDDIKKQDEARRKVAGFDPKIREQVSQAPSLISPDAPSLPYGKDELGYDHPFKGSPELIEDVARSLKGEKGETDWLAAAARGTRIQTIADKAKEHARVNQEARDRAIFAQSIETLGERLRLEGRDGKGYSPRDEKETGMPHFLQLAHYEWGAATEELDKTGRDRDFLTSVRKDLLTTSQGLSSWGHKHVNPKTVAEASDAYASIAIAKAKKNLFDTQQQVLGDPPNLIRMDKPEIADLRIGEVNNLTRQWSEALEDQRIKRIGAEAKAKHDATKETPQEEYDRYRTLEGLKIEGVEPYYKWRNVKGIYDSDPSWIPNFEKWEEETGKKATQEMYYMAKEEMARSGADIHDPPLPNWRKDAEKERKRVADEPKRVMELDRQAWRSLNAKAAAGEDMSEYDRKYLGQLNEMFGSKKEAPAPREVDINTLSEEQQRGIRTYPEGKPFKTSSGVWFVRRGSKLIPVESPE